MGVGDDQHQRCGLFASPGAVKQAGGIGQILPAALNPDQNRIFAGVYLENGVDAAIALNGNNRQTAETSQRFLVRLNVTSPPLSQ